MQSSMIATPCGAASISGRPSALPQLRVLGRHAHMCGLTRRVVTNQESQTTEAELEKIMESARRVGKLPVPMMEEAEALKKRFVAIQQE